MSEIGSLSRNDAASADASLRSHDGRQPPDAESTCSNIDIVDPHPNWLKEWRRLRAGPGGGQVSESPAELVGELQNRIAHTPANTLAGLQAQAELISELAWNDVVAATARRLVAGLRRINDRTPDTSGMP